MSPHELFPSLSKLVRRLISLVLEARLCADDDGMMSKGVQRRTSNYSGNAAVVGQQCGVCRRRGFFKKATQASTKRAQLF
jgi:hypothetical protein